MNELIKVTPDGKISSRELYEFLQLNWSHYSRWCKANIVQNVYATEGEDWWGSPCVVNGNETMDYMLTADFSEKLCMLSPTERGNQARNFFVEVKKRFAKQQAQLATADPLDMVIMLAQNAKEAKMKMAQLENRMAVVEAKQITSPMEYFSISGFASLRGIKISPTNANILGRKASDLSRQHGYEIGKISDPRYGHVNTYHIDMLDLAFEDSHAGLFQ